MKSSKPYLLTNARALRNHATAEEKKLWYQCLNQLPLRFWRQKIIGNYIVDFCCPKAKLVVELDGSQHYEDENKEKDNQRDAYLNSMGYKVLRYSNLQIHFEFEAVCQDIFNHITPP